MLDDFLDDGIEIVPGEGSDIADPDVVDIAYAGTPLAPLMSLLLDGVAPITDRFGELTMPLRLFTSRNDHVVDPADSEHLAAHYGGPVEHTWLERSYHVATRDYDRDLIVAEIVAFVDAGHDAVRRPGFVAVITHLRYDSERRLEARSRSGRSTCASTA